MSAPGDGEAAGQAEAERKRLVGRAGIVGAGTLASRVLGLARDIVWAAIFSARETDAFFVAWTIPNALRQLLGEGVMSSAVVPVLSAKIAREGDESARAFVQRLRGVSLLGLVTVTALGMIFARPLTELFASGYHGVPEEFERTVTLTRELFPYLFFIGTAALGMASLHSMRQFAVASFAPALLNVAFLLAALGLPSLLATHGIDRAQALVVGALLGGVLQVIAQWPALARIGFLRRPILDLRDPGVRDVLRRIGPMTLGIGVYYIDLTLSRRFLSELGTGAQSHFNWASRLCDFPQGIFVMALSTAALPSLSLLAAKGDMKEVARTYAHGFRLAMFVSIPASVATVALAEPLVVTLFQRGAFDAHAAHETARALVWQGAAIWTVSAVRQVIPVFYALGDSRTPVIVSALDLIAFIVLSLLLRGPMGHVGISAAIAGSSTVQMILLLVALKWRLGTLRAGEIGASVARTAGASLAGALVGAGVAAVLGPHLQGGFERMVPGVAGGAAFVAVFAVVAHLVRSPELAMLTGGVKRRLARRAAAR